jgi:hypothetical protein
VLISANSWSSRCAGSIGGAIKAPFSLSHRRMVPSPPPVTMRWPVGVIATDSIQCESVAIRSSIGTPVTVSHRLRFCHVATSIRSCRT